MRPVLLDVHLERVALDLSLRVMHDGNGQENGALCRNFTAMPEPLAFLPGHVLDHVTQDDHVSARQLYHPGVTDNDLVVIPIEVIRLDVGLPDLHADDSLDR